jgi:hypothetical protein
MMDASEKLAPANIGVERIYGERQLEHLILAIPIVGILVSVFSLAGIIAAHKSIQSLAKEWTCRQPKSNTGENKSTENKSPGTEYRLPNIICGYGKPASLFEVTHTLIPCMFIVVWLLLLVSWVLSKNRIAPLH